MSVDISKVHFDEKGLVPAIVQEESGQVLMLAYMNKESLEKTIETGLTWFYSRSRQRLWQKGEESGNIQQVKEISYDCDGDTLLVRVHQRGVACHTGTYSCFSGRRLHPEDSGKNVAVMVAMGNSQDNGIYVEAFNSELRQNGAHIVGERLYAGISGCNLDNWVCAVSPNL